MNGTPDHAKDFGAAWVAAWNSRDLDLIISHYAEDIVLFSPNAQRMMGDGCVKGKAALRDYWSRGLAAQPNLKFVLDEVLAGFNSVTILYRNHRLQYAAETLEFNADGKAVRTYVCYSAAQAA